MTVFASALGIASTNANGDMIEVFYQKPLFKPSAEIAAIFGEYAEAGQPTLLGNQELQQLANALREVSSEQSELADALTQSARPIVLIHLLADEAPSSVAEAYLKLHLLSHRLVKPHEINLSGIFASLPNLAWTNVGAVDLEDISQRHSDARARGDWLSVKSIDKFPPMADYVVPEGVRIADTARVRLGAYVGKGTTIMHEGFINFNAGTAGTSMIEGRISAGVFVGEGSDLGGGSSTMGTLSGGGDVVISVGENCLIGANAGTGIALGDRCIIEAGLYITAGTKVQLLDENGAPAQEIKARELSGQSDLLFRRNSISGTIECKTNKTVVELNEALHANN